MRLFRAIFLLFCLTTATRAQGMFDLLPGRWQGPVKGQGILSLEVGGSDTRSIQFSFHGLSADLRTATATGTYTVTATKGDPHFTFHVADVKCAGKLQTDPQGGFNFCGWTLRPGADARGIIHYEQGYLTLDVFNPKTMEHIGRFQLQAI